MAEIVLDSSGVEINRGLRCSTDMLASLVSYYQGLHMEIYVANGAYRRRRHRRAQKRAFHVVRTLLAPTNPSVASLISSIGAGIFHRKRD